MRPARPPLPGIKYAALYMLRLCNAIIRQFPHGMHAGRGVHDSTLSHAQAAVQTEDEPSSLRSEASMDSCMQQLSQAEETAAAARADAAALRSSVQQAKADVDTLRQVPAISHAQCATAHNSALGPQPQMEV